MSSISNMSMESSISSQSSLDERNFDDIVLLKRISKAKFPVFLAHSPSLNEYFAVKLFSYKNDKPSVYFLNEARFSALSHKNIISIVHAEFEREGSYQNNKTEYISYLVMELAPYGDFYDLVMTAQISFDDLLARTFFHQLIEGIEYLHAHGVAHLDLKPHNLLIGNNFQLKIADFDLSLIEGDSTIKGKGSKFYRAPELLGSNIRAPELADIYSAGIFLFLLKTRGTLPHTEGMKYKGVNLFELMNEDNDKFWKTHLEFLGEEDNFFDEDFKNLFNSMTKKKAKDRASIQEIKKSKWYNGPIYDDKELIRVMSHYIPNNSRTV